MNHWMPTKNRLKQILKEVDDSSGKDKQHSAANLHAVSYPKMSRISLTKISKLQLISWITDQ